MSLKHIAAIEVAVAKHIQATVDRDEYLLAVLRQAVALLLRHLLHGVLQAALHMSDLRVEFLTRCPRKPPVAARGQETADCCQRCAR